MAAGGARVRVVEGDLRRPRLLEYMGLDDSLGLTNVLIGKAHLGDALQQFSDAGLYVLGAGSIPPNPSELLGSVLSTIAGGTVVVVGVGLVDRDHLARSLQSLDAVKGRVLGLVLNLLPTKGADSYYYRGYAAESPRKRAKERTHDVKPPKELRPAGS